MRRAFPSAAPAVGMGYGSSESVAVIAGIGGAEYRERPTSCGRVAIGFEVEIRDPDGQVLPTGTEGDIWCRSAYTMLEYWNNPEATAATIAQAGGSTPATSLVRRRRLPLHQLPGPRHDPPQRREHLPIEIEYRLDAHPSVAESAVFGVDHPEMGQEVKAVVVPASDAHWIPPTSPSGANKYSPPTKSPRSGKSVPSPSPATPPAK